MRPSRALPPKLRGPREGGRGGRAAWAWGSLAVLFCLPFERSSRSDPPAFGCLLKANVALQRTVDSPVRWETRRFAPPPLPMSAVVPGFDFVMLGVAIAI